MLSKPHFGKLFPFFIPTEQNNFFQTGKWPNFFLYFSRLRRNLAHVSKHKFTFRKGQVIMLCCFFSPTAKI